MRVHVARSLPAEPGEERLACGLHGGVEAEGACRLGVGAGRPHQGRADARGAADTLDDQAGAGPPADVGITDRGDAHAAHDPAVRVDGHEDHGAGVVVEVVGVGPGEEALLLHERPTAQRPVGSQARSLGHLDQDPRGAAPSARPPVGGEEVIVAVVGEERHDQPPATDSAEQAPHAAHPAPWSAPRIPMARSPAATRSVTSASTAGSGGPTPSCSASVPARGR